MEGIVTFYNPSKGFGFIKTEGEDHYFRGSDVQGLNILRTGDRVDFSALPQGPKDKNPRAIKIKLTAKASENKPRKDRTQQERSTPAAADSQRPNDDREVCTACGKRMVPRMTFRNSEPYRSFCPYCGAVHRKFTPCFIATAVYGDTLAPEVQALRVFRDQALMPYMLGRAFVKTYYTVSPPIARFLKSRPGLAAPVRRLLDVMVQRLQSKGKLHESP
jgi:cold shock CspA family protein